MIPTIETIVEDLLAGRITKPAAITWLLQHAEDAHYDLRDLFAGNVLPTVFKEHYRSSFRDIAKIAYSMADEMMNERRK